MNRLRNKVFLCMLLCSSSLYPVESIIENQKIAIHNISINSLIVGVVGFGTYLAFTKDIPEEFYVKNSHPLAQVWYDEMAVKYPQAHFAQRRFLSARRGFLNNSVSWESAYNDIYAPVADLQRIHEIYTKKNENIEITEEDTILLYVYEFLLLHEAAHIENKDSLNRYAAMLSLITGIEAIKYVYRVNDGYNPLVYEFFGIKNHLDKCVGALGLCIGYYSYVRYTEARADKFACDQADSLEVLDGGLRFFNYLTTLGVMDLEHPSSESRAQAVWDEIQKRKSQN